jgi:DNA-binding NtrC family response regulator
MEFPALAPLTVRTTPESRTGPAGQAWEIIIVDVAQMAADVPNMGLILVVEDEEIIREFVCEILADEGFATHAMETADEAATYLETHSGDVALLLTDILMPGSLNGADLANLSSNKYPHIPILIMSGHETPESSGVVNPVVFIRKPWSFGQLLQGVNRALGYDKEESQ